LKNKRAESFLHLAIHLLSVVPAAWLILAYFTNGLGVNPVQYLERRTGDYALILLLASLACTPLRIISGKGFFTRLRRPLGL
jgi:sulfoxide reductase heme-binding subunit YedZ